MVARRVGTPRSAGRISSLLKSEVRKYARISGCSDPSAQEIIGRIQAFVRHLFDVNVTEYSMYKPKEGNRGWVAIRVANARS